MGLTTEGSNSQLRDGIESFKNTIMNVRPPSTPLQYHNRWKLYSDQYTVWNKDQYTTLCLLYWSQCNFTLKACGCFFDTICNGSQGVYIGMKWKYQQMTLSFVQCFIKDLFNTISCCVHGRMTYLLYLPFTILTHFRVLTHVIIFQIILMLPGRFIHPFRAVAFLTHVTCYMKQMWAHLERMSELNQKYTIIVKMLENNSEMFSF